MRCLVLGARLAASLFFLALALPATAQEFRGSITGKISDSSGAILPGVTITATNVDTGGKTTAVTNGEGVYFIPFLQPGKYTVAAELMRPGEPSVVPDRCAPVGSGVVENSPSRRAQDAVIGMLGPVSVQLRCKEADLFVTSR